MSSLYCLFSDFECRLWPLKAISVKVIQGKVPLFFIGLAMFKMAFFCQTSRFWDPLASGPLLVRSDGHLKSATFWLYDCPCEMELSTSFQSKMSKFQCLSNFFQKNQATDLLLFVLVRKGRKVGARIKQQWDSWKCQESWFGLCFCNLKPFAAFWRIPDQCL